VRARGSDRQIGPSPCSAIEISVLRSSIFDHSAIHEFVPVGSPVLRRRRRELLELMRFRREFFVEDDAPAFSALVDKFTGTFYHLKPNYKESLTLKKGL
jgi:hypothetical protein